MKNYLFIILLVGICFGQEQTLSDGPYIFIEKNELIEKKIINNKVISKTLEIGSYDTVYHSERSTFHKIRKISEISENFRNESPRSDRTEEIRKNQKIFETNVKEPLRN